MSFRFTSTVDAVSSPRHDERGIQPPSTRRGLRVYIIATLILSNLSLLAQGIAAFDPAMAESRAVVDTNGVKWIDGKLLPLEGKAFADTELFYDRLPAGVTTNVNGGVRSMKHHATGLQFRFRTDSPFLVLRHLSLTRSHAMYHMTECGVSGFDVYRRGKAGDPWRFVTSSHGAQVLDAKTGERQKRINWRPGDECLVNLPLYNGTASFALGLAHKARVEALAPRTNGVNRPVVFYGTSITHGGCASRPGLAFPSIVGRDLDVPTVNLGFSGSGVMEYEMSEHLARIDASCYVLDCLWNMHFGPNGKPGRRTEENYEPFIRNLRAKRPDVPIVMAGRCDVYCNPCGDQEKFVETLYRKLKAEGWQKLYYLPGAGMLGDDFEGTVDGCHPNDLGMALMAKAYGKAVREALGLDLSQATR